MCTRRVLRVLHPGNMGNMLLAQLRAPWIINSPGNFGDFPHFNHCNSSYFDKTSFLRNAEDQQRDETGKTWEKNNATWQTIMVAGFVLGRKMCMLGRYRLALKFCLRYPPVPCFHASPLSWSTSGAPHSPHDTKTAALSPQVGPCGTAGGERTGGIKLDKDREGKWMDDHHWSVFWLVGCHGFWSWIIYVTL